jgi:hypothetical protein
MAKRDVKNAIKSYESAVDRGQKNEASGEISKMRIGQKEISLQPPKHANARLRRISPRNGVAIISGQDTWTKET